MDYEIKNAIIKKCSLDIGDRGLLTSFIELDYGNGVFQHFGGYCLYLPKSFSHHKLNSCAGHFIFRVLEIAGVNDWKELSGRPVRVKSNSNNVHSIGHIINDDWFSPKDDFES